MFTKYENLTGELCDISCPRRGKVQLDNYKILQIHEMEKFNWRTLRYLILTMYENLAGELSDISCPGSGKV